MSGRAAGLLLHPTALPGRYGVGDLGPGADAFLDWARAAGQTLWQILPLGPTDGNGSPYSALSLFAGNPLLISPERLIEDGFLPDGAPPPDAGPADAVDFDRATTWKGRVLRAAWDRFRRDPSGMDAFAAAPARASWLDDWSLFAAIRAENRGRPWIDWPAGERDRDPVALASARLRLADEIAYRVFLQFLFDRQWSRVRGEAERRGIRILGDVPIYPALDSADVWARRDLFVLDADGRPERVAGVPPDYFCSDGQLWGNPLYRWDRMESDGFTWWVRRLEAELVRSHLVRMDHFRGFAAFWEVPAGERTAAPGRWVEGPGARLLGALRDALGALPAVAEDLGFITEDVARLRDAFGLPGMKVLQFAFGEEDSPHLPHRHTPRTFVYTGTHDNDTTRGWFATAGDPERRRLLAYTGSDGRTPEWDLIRLAYASVAQTAIVPLQDVFGLDTSARMNVPGRASGNWAWRAPESLLTREAAERLRTLAVLTGRAGGGA